MTVCIAAICNSGKAIVVAADRMFTNQGLSVEFETDEKKIEQLGSRCVALASGNSAHATEVFQRVRIRLAGNSHPSGALVTEWVREEYSRVKNRKAFETIAAPMLGMDFERFQAGGMSLPNYLERQGPMYQQLLVMMNQQHNLGLEVLVTGLDESGAYLAHVANPGVLSPLQKLGHFAIGTGGPHAMLRLSLEQHTRHRDLMDTLARVFSAKRGAEVAPGVGKATDIAVIDEHTEIWHCPQPVLDELERVHTGLATPPTRDLTKLSEVYNEQRKAH